LGALLLVLLTSTCIGVGLHLYGESFAIPLPPAPHGHAYLLFDQDDVSARARFQVGTNQDEHGTVSVEVIVLVELPQDAQPPGAVLALMGDMTPVGPVDVGGGYVPVIGGSYTYVTDPATKVMSLADPGSRGFSGFISVKSSAVKQKLFIADETDRTLVHTELSPLVLPGKPPERIEPTAPQTRESLSTEPSTMSGPGTLIQGVIKPKTTPVHIVGRTARQFIEGDRKDDRRRYLGYWNFRVLPGPFSSSAGSRTLGALPSMGSFDPFNGGAFTWEQPKPLYRPNQIDVTVAVRTGESPDEGISDFDDPRLPPLSRLANSVPAPIEQNALAWAGQGRIAPSWELGDAESERRMASNILFSGVLLGIAGSAALVAVERIATTISRHRVAIQAQETPVASTATPIAIAPRTPRTPRTLTAATPSPAPRGITIDAVEPGLKGVPEHVVLRNCSDSAIDLDGLILTNSAYVAMRLPDEVVVAPGTTARVFTGDEPDDSSAKLAEDIYLGRGSAVWKNKGDKVMLILADGSVIDQVRYMVVGGKVVYIRDAS